MRVFCIALLMSACRATAPAAHLPALAAQREPAHPSAGCGAPAPVVQGNRTLTSGGRTRRFRLLVPPSALPGPAPLVLNIHGLVETAQVHEWYTAMDEPAAERGTVLVYPQGFDQSCIGAPDHPGVFVFDKNFKNPRTKSSSVSWEEEAMKDYSFLVKYNYAKGEHITRFIDRNDPLLGSPWSSGLGSDGKNGVGVLTTVESSARSLYHGVTVGITKRPSQNLQFQAYYTYSKDKSDDDNERDPFSFRYAKITDLAAEYNYSDRDQRHRINSWMLWNAPLGLDLNLRYSYRSAQPQSLSCVVSTTFCGNDGFGNPRFNAVAQTPQDRINPDGSVTKRNLGRKDNQFSSLDFRLSKRLPYGQFTIEPAVDVFNLFNSKNLRRPEVTNLIFNFDGTVQSGTGDPRQMQVGVRLLW